MLWVRGGIRLVEDIAPKPMEQITVWLTCSPQVLAQVRQEPGV
jgi:hypothetical protein